MLLHAVRELSCGKTRKKVQILCTVFWPDATDSPQEWQLSLQCRSLMQSFTVNEIKGPTNLVIVVNLSLVGNRCVLILPSHLHNSLSSQTWTCSQLNYKSIFFWNLPNLFWQTKASCRLCYAQIAWQRINLYACSWWVKSVLSLIIWTPLKPLQTKQI